MIDNIDAALNRGELISGMTHFLTERFLCCSSMWFHVDIYSEMSLSVSSLIRPPLYSGHVDCVPNIAEVYFMTSLTIVVTMSSRSQT